MQHRNRKALQASNGGNGKEDRGAVNSTKKDPGSGCHAGWSVHDPNCRALPPMPAANGRSAPAGEVVMRSPSFKKPAVAKKDLGFSTFKKMSTTYKRKTGGRSCGPTPKFVRKTR